jgi:cold shock CspA family protein
MRERGKVATWHAARGYGFITPAAGGHDIFVHIGKIDGEYDRLARGMEVEYEVVTAGDGRERAINVTIV